MLYKMNLYSKKNFHFYITSTLFDTKVGFTTNLERIYTVAESIN